MDGNLFGEPEQEQDRDTASQITPAEGVNEPDSRDTSLSSPRDNPCLIGHDTIVQQLLDWHARHALPHALIFSGPRGIGKATAAFALARTLLQEAGEPGTEDDSTNSLFGGAGDSDDSAGSQPGLLMDAQDPVFRKVAAQSHPDCLDIAREFDEKKQRYKTELQVNQIRHIQDFLHMRASTPGGMKIAIIDEAATMNRNAQNALLKSLEEPPGNSLLIIVADQLGALLPTIRSRVRVMPFAPLESGELRALLKHNIQGPDEDDLHAIVEIAQGAAGPALELASEEGVSVMRHVLTIVQDWPHLSWGEIYKLSAYVTAPKDSEPRLRVFYYVMTWLAQHMLRIKTRNITPAPALQTGTLPAAIGDTSLDMILQICDNLKSHFDSAYSAHLDKHYIVEGAFTILTNYKAKAA